MGAPVGNQNAVKAKKWADAINYALAEAEREGKAYTIRDLARSLLIKASEGDMAALKELGDRLDGKAVQAVAGPDGQGPVSLLIQWALPKSS